MSLGLKMHACASAPAGGSARAATTRTPARSISAFRAISAHGHNARSLSSGTTGSVLRGSSTLPPPARLTSCRSESSRRARGALRVFAGAVSPGETVLVVGATGGVGQLVTAKLIEKGYKVKVAVRSKEKAALLFGDAVEAVIADTRSPEGLPALLEGVDAVACCTGTTAFPSKRWDADNGPEQTDLVGTKNLVEAASSCDLKRFLLVTSVGVERYGSFPFIILNAFGVLKFKKMGEEVLQASGIPYTIVRPGRLTDGPYTSFDLNTLLKATSGTRQDVELSPDDDLNGEASRIAVAECVAQALGCPVTEGMVLSISSTDGPGPGQDQSAWAKLFDGVKQKAAAVKA